MCFLDQIKFNRKSDEKCKDIYGSRHYFFTRPEKLDKFITFFENLLILVKNRF